MIRYWTWLSLCLDNGSAHLVPLLERFGTPKDILDAQFSDPKLKYRPALIMQADANINYFVEI